MNRTSSDEGLHGAETPGSTPAHGDREGPRAACCLGPAIPGERWRPVCGPAGETARMDGGG
jgi:hypothetical protein